MSMPVEAATAFANLYQRWFDDARGLAEPTVGKHGARSAHAWPTW
ncbi:MAG: hypothetical protein ACLR67_05455 [Eggerthella lenta]